MKIKNIIYITLVVICAFFASTSFIDFLLKAVFGSIVFLFILSFLFSTKIDKTKISKDFKNNLDNLDSKASNKKSKNKSDKKDDEFSKENIVKKYKFNVAGVTYKCKLDDKEKRQEILDTCTKGERLSVEKYLYKGKPAYLLVTEGWYKYDIGVVPAHIAEEISDNYAFKKRVAYIENIDTFVNEHDKTIIYAKVILYILDESSPENDECII